MNIKNSIQPVLVIFAIGRLRHRSKSFLSGCKRQPFSLPCRNEGWGQPMLHKGGQNAMTNKRLYLVSWSADIRTSRRRGWCSYIELLSTCHFGLPGDWPLYKMLYMDNVCMHCRVIGGHEEQVAMRNSFLKCMGNAIERVSARPRPTSSWCSPSAP